MLTCGKVHVRPEPVEWMARPMHARDLLALMLSAGIVTGSACVASAEASGAAALAAMTGKERLSDKASDEQRIDNCKVPPERRGLKARPATCDPRPAEKPGF